MSRPKPAAQADTKFQKTFLTLEPLIWQKIVKAIETSPSTEEDPTNAILTAQLTQILIDEGFDTTLAAQTASQLSALYNTETTRQMLQTSYYTPNGGCPITLYSSDLFELKTRLQAIETTHADTRLIRLLIALVMNARANFHQSGWINFQEDVIFYLAGLQNLTEHEKCALTATLHKDYDFDMQVVGSKHPIPCYKLNFMKTKPQELEREKITLFATGFHPDTTKYIYHWLEDAAI